VGWVCGSRSTLQYLEQSTIPHGEGARLGEGETGESVRPNMNGLGPYLLLSFFHLSCHLQEGHTWKILPKPRAPASTLPPGYLEVGVLSHNMTVDSLLLCAMRLITHYSQRCYTE
jgi:hypothetical protein